MFHYVIMIWYLYHALSLLVTFAHCNLPFLPECELAISFEEADAWWIHQADHKSELDISFQHVLTRFIMFYGFSMVGVLSVQSCVFYIHRITILLDRGEEREREREREIYACMYAYINTLPFRCFWILLLEPLHGFRVKQWILCLSDFVVLFQPSRAWSMIFVPPPPLIEPDADSRGWQWRENDDPFKRPFVFIHAQKLDDNHTPSTPKSPCSIPYRFQFPIECP